ncbi:hypothetical protein ACFXTN_034443 [Malus domestica]
MGEFQFVLKSTPPSQPMLEFCSRPQEDVMGGNNWKELLRDWVIRSQSRRTPFLRFSPFSKPNLSNFEMEWIEEGSSSVSHEVS